MIGIWDIVYIFICCVQPYTLFQLHSLTGGDSPNNPSSGRFLKNLGRFYQSCWELGDFFLNPGRFYQSCWEVGAFGKILGKVKIMLGIGRF